MTKDAENILEAFQIRLGNRNALPVDEFVELALYHPALGYYQKKTERVGKNKEADFYTSSSLGKLWGEMIIDACMKIAGELKLNDMHFVEIAAEPGRSITNGLEIPFRTSSTIRLGDPIKIPKNSIVFSNEWLDAQPFKRFQYLEKEKKWREIEIIYDQGLFKERIGKENQNMPFPENHIDGYILDWPTGATKTLNQLLESSWNGLFLTFDYGLSNEVLFNDRPQGTARAYFKHTLEKNFLEKPGEKDITCHLSWDELKKSLKANSFESINLENQETFFMHHAQKKLKSLFDEKKRNSEFDLNSLKEIINPHFFGSKFQALWAIRR